MDERQYEKLNRDFTEAEMAVLHDALVQKVGEVKELRGKKAQATTEINAQIKGAEKSVWDLQEKLALGYEVVEVEVFKLLDTPTPGLKRIVRADNNKTVREMPMTTREKQQSFGFTELPDDRPEPPK